MPCPSIIQAQSHLSDSTGQHLDLGAWSFGGAHTFTAWIKADEFRDQAAFLSLSGADAISFRLRGTTDGALGDITATYDGTAGGNENGESGSSMIQWGQWVHLAIVMDDLGTNLSTLKFYKNGSLFNSTTGETAPDAVNRSIQYIGRSGTSSHGYFAGDMDEMRLYRIALSASEVNEVYSETNSTTWYTIAGNNNPTSFSATGLPSGLSVNPDTGEISGHTTSAGDHNVTVSASNLSGSDSKVITLTVNAAKPLMETAYTVTRQSDLLGWLKFDETTGTTATNYGSEGSSATLKSGATFSVTEKKFGASALNLPTASTGAYAELTTPIDLPNEFSFSVWFKKLYGTGGYRTLTRDNSSGYHHVIIKTGTNDLGTWSWSDSGYDLPTTTSASSWNHLVATFDGTNVKFYHDGSYVGTSSGDRSSNLFAIGNYQGGGQRWAEYLDDFRTYGVTLSASEVSSIYGKGNGDVFPVTAGSSYATASPTLLETGGADVTISAFYGTSDKGATETGWDSNVTLSGAQTAGQVTVTLSGLSASTNYVFRIKASNSAGAVWSDAYSVLTNSQAQPPAIAANDASSIAGTSATMNGDLLSYDGSDQPSVSLLYGPTSLPLQNVELWLDADESTTVTHSSNAVSQWKDKSGKDNHASQSTAANQPTLTASGLNGKPVITFDGTSDHITSTSLNITQSYSIFLVAKTNNNSTGRDYLFDGIANNADRSLVALDNGGKIQMWALNTWANSNFNTPSGYFVLSAVFNTSSSSLSLNGTRATGLNIGTSSLTNGIRIGCNHLVSADYLDGAIAEFLILDETASLDTQNIVEGYLAHKWGLAGSLPSGHTYKSTASVATTSLGTKSAGTFTHNLTGLTAGQRYEFQFSATNAGGTTLSGVNSFVTLGLPQVLTPGATDVTKTSVTLNADLNSTGGVSYQSGAPFSGSTAPGMLMWMDGNDYNADGSADTTDANLANGTGWKDKSGNGRHATATGGDPRFMSNQLNGLGVIDFDGNDNVYVSNDAHSLAAHTDAFSAFLLVRMTGYNGNDWSRVLASQDWFWYMGPAYGHTKNVAYFNGQVSPNSRDFDSRDTDWHLYQVTVSDLHIANAWRDELKVTSNKGISNHSNRYPKRLYFGGGTTDQCQIAEFFIFNRVVPETERLKIEGYLARKWGLISTMFTAAHPYYSADPYQPTINLGGENAAVTFYWGDNNGSTTPGNWDNSQAISGTHGVGVVSHALTGLTTGNTYYYTAKAVTSAGTSWGPVQTFVPANTALNKYSIADLGLWLDATDLDGDGTTDSVTSGTTVSSWTDKSVGGETVSQSTAENMPTRQANSFGSKAAVRFDGNGDILNVSTIRAESGGYSAYAAVRRPSTSGDASGHLVSESGWNLAPSGSNAGFPAIIAKKSGTAGTLTNIKLGKSASSTSNDFGGDLGELLIFSRQLTATEEQKVEGYLAHKWGATDSLEANHPYKNVAPTFDNKPLINIDSLQTDAIKVDFGRNTTPPLQAGYVGFNPWGSSSSDNGNLVEQTYSNSFGNSSSLKVSVSGQTHWRDYNTITGGPFLSLSNLLSDEVLRNSNGTITIKLSDVKAGEYSVSTYHHASQANGNTTYDLKVTDASGTNRLIAANMTSSGGRTPSTINKQTFDVVSDGSNDIQILVGPGGASGNHLVVNGLDLLAKGYISIETGTNVSIQIPATRNPTSWSASGLPTGLSINNSGVISGSSSTLGEYNATLTAINADGNDSKVLGIVIIKGNRTITWDQTIAGLTYGDSAVSLTATATGSGDLNYTSDDSSIIEINGTSAIIRAGGAVTLTATAAENSTAFAAVPVTKEVSIAKADLALSGQNLSISLGDSIPDLNWTATGWKHNDASLAIGTHPNNLSSLALWLDATDSSTITQSSNVVSQWNDKSGSNYHASQSTADRQPMVATNSIGGKTAIEFDGSDSMGASTRLGLGANPALTVFVVCNIFTDNNTDDRIFHLGHNANSLSVGAGSEGWAWRYDGGNEKYGSVSHGTDYVLAYTRPSAGNYASAKLFINGTEQTRTAGGNDTGSPTSTNANFKIGSNYDGNGNFVNGYIGEIIVIESDSNSDRYGLEGYLAHKWGMAASLPSNHSHKTVSLIRGPKVTTDANSSSSAGTYAINLSDAMSDKYTFTYSTDGELVISSLTEQTIAWGQSFSGVGVGQTVDLNASASSNLAVLYSVDDTSVAELAVTNQSALKAWWKLDEVSGVDASDSSAFSSIGSVENSTTGHWNAGKFGNAITLDGTNDHVRVYGYTGIYGTAGRTVALWFKTSTANKPLLQYGTSGTGTLFKLSINSSGAAVLDLGGATITSSTSGLADGNWHHLAVSFPSAANSSGAKLYVNSTGTNGSGSTTINTNSSKDIIIGRDGDAGSAYFNGQIDDVRFYDGEMNSTLISQLYGNGNGDFNRLKIKAAGSVTITATQPGDSSYAPAPSTTLTATFNKSDQTISFDVDPIQICG